MIKSFKNLLCGMIVLCFALPCTASSQENADPRFLVTLNFENSSTPTLQEQVEQALPILWNRLITQSTRTAMPQDINAMRLLLRVHPQASASTIEFNAARVWQVLQQRNIPHIRQQASFHLQLQVNNAFGSSMQQTADELLRISQQEASDWGIQLQPQAALLAISIQWLDDIHVQVSVRGQSRLAEFSQTRTLNPGDPFTQIQAWLHGILLQARDAYAWQDTNQTQAEETSLTQTVDKQQFTLRIEQEAPLAEQIALESSLQADPRIASITAIYLNHFSREYHIKLNQPDASWIIDWFKQRGMTATPNTQGWLVQ